MSNFFFGGKNLESGITSDILNICQSRTGKKPSIYQKKDILLVSSRDNIDQGELKIAFNGYIIDNEVSPEKYLAEMYRKYGKKMTAHINGQFRFLIYDSEKDCFLASSDKAGRKVIYHSHIENKFLCSSHLKPILRSPSIKPEICEKGVKDYLQGWSASFAGGERLIKNVHRVYPSHYLSFSDGNLSQRKFWDVGRQKKKISDKDAVEKMDELLTEAANKYVNQVEGSLNIFLSGGFDSTFMMALLREVTDKTIHAYTWGWEDNHFESSRKMVDKYGARHTEIKNNYRFPTDKEIKFYEEPQNAFVRYPFYELYNEHNLRNFWTGLNSQSTFPVCLKNIRKLDRISFSKPFLNRMPLERFKNILGNKINYKASKGLEVLESDYKSTAATIDWSIRKDEAERLLSKRLKQKNRELDETINEKWSPPNRSYQENYNYLQLRARDTARYAYYSQDFKHFDIYAYEPLIEFSYSLPISQKKNRRLLQKIAKGRVPETIINKGASGWDFVSDQFRKTIKQNEEEYRAKINQFIDRNLVNEKAAEEILLPKKFDQSSGQINQMIAVYLLERWLNQFIDVEKPWKPV